MSSVTRNYNFHGIDKQARILYDHVYDVVDDFNAGVPGTILDISDKRLDHQKIQQLLNEYEDLTQFYNLLDADYALLGAHYKSPADYDRLRANLVTQRIIHARYPDIKAKDFIRKEKSRLYEQDT